jgi:polyisoprenoid-binding protein YceI
MSALSVFAALLLASAAADLPDPARYERWAIDPAQAQAKFRVRLLGVLLLDGEFRDLGGVILIDRAAGRARVEASIRSASLSMRNADHAAWARSAEFFDTDAWPEIRFDSLDFPVAVLDSGGRIDGELRMRGSARAVDFSVSPGDCAIDTAHQCKVEVFGSVRRSDFGMRSRPGTVGDRVLLRLQIVATRDAPAAAPAHAPAQDAANPP